MARIAHAQSEDMQPECAFGTISEEFLTVIILSDEKETQAQKIKAAGDPTES
jgi:hypothetical protein